MALVCAISNEVPETPVISPVSGAVFEKRLIEKLLAENGNKDPVNQEELTPEMLVEIKTPPFVKAKPPTATSIPFILKSLQDEWDAVMLHSFTLRQQLQANRQELSHAMYQYDAACRVIARLSKDATAAREALIALKPQQPAYLAGAPPPDNFNEPSQSAVIDVIGISQSVLNHLQQTATYLTTERKKKGKLIPEDLRKQEQISNYTVTYSQTGIHSAGSPGITCLDLSGNLIVTGGNDKNVVVHDHETDKIVATLKGHSKKVVAVACHPNQKYVMSGSVDSTVRVWDVSTGHQINVIQAHDDQITGLSLHATGDYILSSSLDRSWAFSDLNTGQILAKVCPDDGYPLTCAKFHPDGLIFAVGLSNAEVKIWDLKEKTNVANFAGHEQRVTAMSFSENGYYLATASEDHSVKLWDLRKLKNFKSLAVDERWNNDDHIMDLTFDQSGSYLAFIGSDLRVYNARTWNQVVVFSEHTALGTGVRFGPSASYIVSTSLDRAVKKYGPPPS